MGDSSKAQRRFQFGIRGLLAYVLVFAVALRLLRFAATACSPVSSPVVGVIGVLLLGATLGAPIGAGMLLAALSIFGAIAFCVRLF
jgi:hypothetical protein